MRYSVAFGVFPSIIILMFILFKCFEVVNTEEQFGNVATIKNDVVNIRNNPSKNSEIILKSNTGDKFKFIEIIPNNWCKIIVNNDTAFVHGDFVIVKNELVNTIEHRRYEDSPNMRFLILCLSFIPLLIWIVFLNSLDKKKKIKNKEKESELKYNNHLIRGKSYAKSNDIINAIKEFDKAIYIKNESSEAFEGKADCYFIQGDYNNSLLCSKKVLEIKSNDYNSIYNIALCYYFLEEDKSAQAYFQKALTFNDRDGRIYKSLGMIEKDYYISISHLEKALEFGDDITKEEKEILKKAILNKCLLVAYELFENNKKEKAKIYFELALKYGVVSDAKELYQQSANLLKENGLIELANKYFKLAGLPQIKITIKKGDTVELLNGKKAKIIKYLSNSQITLDSGDVINKEEIRQILTSEQSVAEIKFTEEYYNLLIDFSKQLEDIANKLKNDEFLVDKLQNSIIDSTPESFIHYCMLYDCSKVLKILSNNKIKRDSLEMFGLTVLSNHLNPEANKVLNLEYEAVNLSFSNKIFLEMSDLLIEIANKNNPLNISVHDKIEGQVTSSKNIESNLSLPSALKIIDHPLFDEYATTLYRFASVISKADNIVTKDEEEALKAIYQLLHNPLPEEKNNSLNILEVNKNESLIDVLKELDSLIGLDDVKNEVKSLINYIKIQKEREKVGLKSSQVSYHCVFTGSPGTGKTTIARIVAKIYMHLGVLKKGHLVETDRSGLIAEYTGQTAVKVNKTVNSALDGVLFIDEAYSLVGENQDDFGKEAVATLIKRMEDDRDKLIVIIAGYTNEMKTFIDTNPGFKSRFNRFIEFVDYNPEEMELIYKSQCKKLDYVLTEEAQSKLKETLTIAFSNRDKSFGNGRFVRNIFEKSLEKQANRIACLSSLTKDVLTTITIEDIPTDK